MKKKSLKSLSLKKSSVANITGGAQDAQAQNAAAAVSTVVCPTVTTITVVHTVFPWDCPTMSCNSICEWCKLLDD